ncbi:WYL domain-containing protein [Cellulomonas septica]|uniref:WYL domain-containing protein n=2 Tax=Cellulomonas septica TaxID=285080 RepID=A0ABX1JV66_9CELL|nr:WYL domain-containing protein [Cellulomonas septica]
MAAEKGSGFVAAAGEETRNAIRSGVVPPIEGNALVKDPSAYYYRRNPAGDPPFLLTRFADSSEPALTLVREGSGWKIAAGALSRREEGAALVASWSDDLRRGFAALVGRFADATVVPLRGVATTRRRLQEVVTGAQQYELRQILAEALRSRPDPLVEATQSVDALLAHEIVVVRGTDQLRAYNYRLAFETAAGAPASGDLHHLIPLYLGGDHRRLVDIEPLLHDRLHTLIEGIPIGDGVTLAPSSIQNSAARPDSTTTAVLVQGCAEHRRIRLTYRSGNGTEWDADVEPWSVVVRHSRWYLLCRTARDEVRAYRVDRVRAATVLDEVFTPPADLDPVALLEENLATGWEYATEVEIDAPLDDVARWVSPALGRLTAVDAQTTRLVGSTSNPWWYAEQLVRTPAPYRVIGCPELRETTRALGRRLLDAAG